MSQDKGETRIIRCERDGDGGRGLRGKREEEWRGRRRKGGWEKGEEGKEEGGK